MIQQSTDEGRSRFDSFAATGDRYDIFFQGIILNKSELVEEHKIIDFEEYLGAELHKEISFVNKLRGSFLGYLYNKTEQKIYIFNDHLSTKNIYYSLDESIEIAVTTRYSDFFNCDVKLDDDSAKMLLSYGYMLEEKTILANVKKLSPGHVLIINCLEAQAKNISFLEYFKLTEEKIEISVPEAIEKVDQLFRKAVKRQFDKDIEYGKRHFVALSGGLDSRMTAWVAHDMGYTHQTNFTFSQSDYLDETIAKKIASDLKHDWIFKFLDNGNFLYDIEEITEISGGNVLYYGLAHSNSFLKLLNFNEFGLLHSGQLGDVVIGSFIKNFDSKDLSVISGAYSNLGMDLLSFQQKYKSFEEKEIDLIYQRGINGANSGLTLINNYTETFSPFYDIDFFQFCVSLPIKMRANHKLYKKWILTKYPAAFLLMKLPTD